MKFIQPTVYRSGKESLQFQEHTSISHMRSARAFRSPYEKVVRDALRALGIAAYYEPLSFYLTGNKLAGDKPFSPDFVTKLIINGKNVVIEFHSYFDPEYLKKLSGFKSKHGDEFYLILISRLRAGAFVVSTGGPVNNFVDAYWSIGEWYGCQDYPRLRKEVIMELSQLLRSNQQISAL